MATIAPVLTGPNEKGVITIVWETITATNDVGGHVDVSAYPDKSFQVSGTFGTGGTVSLEGSNDPVTPTNWFILTDHVDAAITIGTAGGLVQVAQNPRWVRVDLSAGTGTIDLDAVLVCAPRNR